MEKKVALTFNGQAVGKAEVELLGETAALADDRILAELFRLTPYDGTAYKGIIPYGVTKPNISAMVQSVGGLGSVSVLPFRAVVGSRVTVGTEARKNWRDVRSGLSLAEASTTDHVRVTFANNASGSDRWDLVWARVDLDVPSATVNRKVKDVDTSVVTSQSVSTSTKTTVTLGVTQGTPAATPVFPTIPPDVAGVSYYIPIAYAQILSGFLAVSGVLDAAQIVTVAPCLHMAKETGAVSASVMTSSYELTGEQYLTAPVPRIRSNRFVPSSMTGGESVWVLIDLTSAVPGERSHASHDVLDSRDWRNRLCTVFAYFGDLATEAAWASSVDDPTAVRPHGRPPQFSAVANPSVWTMGQTMIATGYPTVDSSAIAIISDNNTDALAVDTLVAFYVDHADGGKLKLVFSNNIGDPGDPRCLIIARIDFSGVFENIR